MRTAMSCPVGRQESAIPCSPPTDPTGFIYSYKSTLVVVAQSTLRGEDSGQNAGEGVAQSATCVTV